MLDCPVSYTWNGKRCAVHEVSAGAIEPGIWVGDASYAPPRDEQLLALARYPPGSLRAIPRRA